MKHTYLITGMTCQNCVDKITKALLSVPGITLVEVNLEKETADITMTDHVQTPVMQESLKPLGNYTISMDTGTSMEQVKKKNHLKDLVPLFVIGGVILVFSILMTLFNDQNFGFGMRMFMGAFFVVFGLLKIIKLKDFAIAYKEYDLIAMRSNIYAHLYPFIELGLGILYFTNVMLFITNIITVIVMGIGAVGVYLKLKKKEEIPCACLGTVFKVPMTWVTLVEDLFMALMALITILMSVGYQLVSLEDINTSLNLHLMLHADPDEWVLASHQGHVTLGIFLVLLIIISSFNMEKRWQKIFTRVSSVLVFIGGVMLATAYLAGHNDQLEVIEKLITDPTTQLFQHAFGGVMLMVAGIAAWYSVKRPARSWSRYIQIIVIFLTGILFFFHQQLGDLESVLFSMNYHMGIGAAMIIASVAYTLYLILDENYREFFVTWVFSLGIAALMLGFYREPARAYQHESFNQQELFKEQFNELKDTWKFF